jgi:hypothetical protein
MNARLIFLFFGLSSVLTSPDWSSAQTSPTPIPVTITQAYCVARPLALASNANALPTDILTGDIVDDQLRSATSGTEGPFGRTGAVRRGRRGRG